MTYNNLHKQYIKAESIIKLYTKWNLSLIGKICVLKTMIIPLFIHILSVLPEPDQSFYQKINNLFKMFIWNRGRVMVSLDQMSHSIENGGLKMTKLDIIAKALKINWVKRMYLKTGNWHLLVADILNENSHDQIWELDHISLVDYSKRLTNPFWKDVLYSWSRYVRCINEEVPYYRRPIWHSYFIKNPNFKMIKNSLVRNECKYIGDLFDNDTKRPYTHSEFNTKYNSRVNYLDYLSLIHSIPISWRNQIQNRTDNINEYDNLVHISSLLNKPKVCSYIYWTLVNKSVQINEKNIIRWSEILNIDVDIPDWNNIYCIPYYATIDTKLRTFQYKLLRRVLVTNIHLKLYGIKTYEECDFCKQEKETYEHLFVQCIYVRKLWDQLIKWLEPEITISNMLNTKNIILGFSLNNLNNDIIYSNLVNKIILITKYYIYKCHCKSVLPFFPHLFLDIKKCFDIESLEAVNLACKWNRIRNKIQM